MEVSKILGESHARCIVFVDDSDTSASLTSLEASLGRLLPLPPSSGVVLDAGDLVATLLLQVSRAVVLGTGILVSVVVRRVPPFGASAPSALSLFTDTKILCRSVNIRLYTIPPRAFPLSCGVGLW